MMIDEYKNIYNIYMCVCVCVCVYRLFKRVREGGIHVTSPQKTTDREKGKKEESWAVKSQSGLQLKSKFLIFVSMSY